MTMPTAEQLLERNKTVAAKHTPFPFFSEMPGRPSTLIITCVDPRCDPNNFFDLQLGEALILRNVGGRVGRHPKDIWALDFFVGLKQVFVVHHTDCGCLHMTAPEIGADAKAKLPDLSDDEFEVDYGTFTDVEQSVRDDVKFLHESPLVSRGIGQAVQGFVYDVKTGVVTRVE